MTVLAINGSPNKQGNTAQALKIVTDALHAQGILTQTMHIGDQPIQGCTACHHCRQSGAGRCVHDDLVNEALRLMEQADGLVIGAPVYYAGIAGGMKSFLDRFFFVGAPLRFKVGAAVTVLRRSGAITAFDQLNHYFNLQNMLITPSSYWTAIHGCIPGEIHRDEEGMDILQNTARNMAWLLQTLAYAKAAVPPPEPMPRVSTNFIR